MTEPYRYVYVEADGSARELHPAERAYLEEVRDGWEIVDHPDGSYSLRKPRRATD